MDNIKCRIENVLSSWISPIVSIIFLIIILMSWTIINPSLNSLGIISSSQELQTNIGILLVSILGYILVESFIKTNYLKNFDISYTGCQIITMDSIDLEIMNNGKVEIQKERISSLEKVDVEGKKKVLNVDNNISFFVVGDTEKKPNMDGKRTLELVEFQIKYIGINKTLRNKYNEFKYLEALRIQY